METTFLLIMIGCKSPGEHVECIFWEINNCKDYPFSLLEKQTFGYGFTKKNDLSMLILVAIMRNMNRNDWFKVEAIFFNSSINFFRLILRATVWHRCHPLSAIWSSWNICSLETIVWGHFRLTFSTTFACHWRHLAFPEINLTLFLVLPCKNVQLFLILTWDTIRYSLTNG